MHSCRPLRRQQCFAPVKTIGRRVLTRQGRRGRCGACATFSQQTFGRQVATAFDTLGIIIRSAACLHQASGCQLIAASVAFDWWLLRREQPRVWLRQGLVKLGVERQSRGRRGERSTSNG